MVNDVCSEVSNGLSFLQTEGLLNLHQKSYLSPVTCLVIALHLTSVCAICCGSIRLQWNLSIEETIETQLAVLYRQVSLIQR